MGYVRIGFGERGLILGCEGLVVDRRRGQADGDRIVVSEPGEELLGMLIRQHVDQAVERFFEPNAHPSRGGRSMIPGPADARREPRERWE
jgi:hypothetical protein